MYRGERMTPCDQYIRKISLLLPEICTVKDLVKVGLYANKQAAATARIAHSFPDYFKLGKRIVIPKESVVAWLNKSKVSSDVDQKTIAFPTQITNLQIEDELA
jgi:hypothetical protein